MCGSHHAPWSQFELGIIPLTNTSFCPEVESANEWKSISRAREKLRAHDKHSPFRKPTLAQYEAFLRKVSTLNQGFEFMGLLMCISFAMVLMIVGVVDHKDHIAALLLLAFGVLLTLPAALIRILTGRWTVSPEGQRWLTSPVDDLSSCLYVRQASEAKDMAFGMWAVLQKKAMGDPLPEITYANDLNHIYWTLATQLIRRTSSVQLLYLAAAKGIPGAPSWVPDWSARNGHSWESMMSSMDQTDIYGRPIISKADFYKDREKKASAYFEFDATEKILTVRGRRVCDIDRLTHLGFQETGKTFDKSEQHIHLDNLRMMLNHASTRHGIKTTLASGVLEDSFPNNLLERAGKCYTGPWLEERAIQLWTWAKFCKSHARASPSKVLELLKSEDALGRSEDEE